MTKRILYIQYTNPAAYPPLEHGSLILANDGWEVLFLGIAVAGTEALSFLSHESVRVKLLSQCRRGWLQKLHYLWYCLWVCIWAIIWRPQWVYASDLLSCPAVSILKGLFGKKIVYHEHDSPKQTTASLFVRLCLAARRWVGFNSDLIIFPNQERGRILQKEQQLDRDDIQCVWNCPTKAEVAGSKSQPVTEDMWVLFHGSIVPDRLPMAVLDALAMLPSQVKLRIIGYETSGSQGYVQMLRQHATNLGISNRFEFLGVIPTRQELLSWCMKCDVGMAFMPAESSDVNMQHMTGASNKPFDYLSCGLALLISDLPDWRQLLVDPGYALYCNPASSGSIAAALRWYLEHPEQMRAMGERGRQRIAAEWNYERQFASVLQKLNNGCR